MAQRQLPSIAPLPAHRSLRWRLPLLVAGLVIGALAVFLWAAYDQLTSTLTESGRGRAQAAAAEVAGLLAPSSSQRGAELRRVAADPALRTAIVERSESALASGRARLAAVSSNGGRQALEVWDRSGARVLAATQPADWETGLPAVAPAAGIRLRLTTSSAGQVFADLIEPVPSADGGQPLGAIVMRRPVASASSDTLNRLVGGGARIHLGGDSGEWTDLVSIVTPSPVERSPGSPVAEYTDAAGDRRIGAVAEVPGTPWRVSVAFPRDQFIAPAARFLRGSIFAALTLAVLVGAASHLLTRRMTSALAGLTSASEAIARGDFDRRADVTRPDEIGRLGLAFNAMVDQIQEAHEHLVLAVQGSKIGIWEWNMASNQMFLSPQFGRILGYETDELDADRSALIALLHPDDRPATMAAIEASLEAGAPDYESEHRLQRKDGSYAWVLARGHVMRDAQGSAVRMAGTIIDTSAQRHARDEALARARQAAFVADVATALTGGRDLRSTLTRCTDAMITHLDAEVARVWTAAPTGGDLDLQAASGARAVDLPVRVSINESIVGRIARERREFVDNAVDPAADPAYARLVPPDCTSYAGLPLIVGDRLVGVLCMLGRQPVSGSTMGVLRAVARTIALGIERHRLDESRARFEDLLESAADFVTIGQLDGPPLYVNRAARQALGIGPTEAVPSLFAFRPAGHEELFAQTILPAVIRDGVWRGRTEYVSREGVSIPVSQVSVVHESANGIRYLSTISRDITDEVRVARERERLAEHLDRTERIEAVGQLAGGLAHDFNNLLTIILGFANTLMDQIDPTDERRHDVAQIQRAGERAAQLTRQLLAFSRRQVLNPVALDPATVLDEARPMLRRLAGEAIDVMIKCDPNVSAITFDPSQLELILVNLTANARDAMPSGGRLTIEAGDVDLDAEFCQSHPSIDPGRYVRLSVSDTGVGIDEATKEHIFEPFFTTKGRDKGTGLGLATVFGTLKQSGGSIWVYSEPGVGSTFQIFLPAARDRAPRPLARHGGQVVGGNERILVVEDEVGVRVLAETVLKRAGYQVTSAGHPDEAIALAADTTREFDLLVTDVVMPGQNGVALARALSETRTSLRVLFISGFADDAIAHHGVEATRHAFLQKPFTGSDLARRVREVLDGPSVDFRQAIQ